MELRVFIEPQQGATYDDMLGVALEAEELGFDAIFRSDHYLKTGLVSGLPGPSDAWTTLAGLARDTNRIRLGTLVTSATFRHPGALAIQVAQVDRMSGGRIELGLGAGWFEPEHRAYGIPFPAIGERFDRFAEQLEVITGLWSTPVGGRYSFAGHHYQLVDSPALPKPLQSNGHRHGPPLLVGGLGQRRTPELAARYADEFNVPFADLDVSKAQFARVRAAAERLDRDPGQIVMSNALVMCVGSADDEVRRRARAIRRQVSELRINGIAGTPAEAIDAIRRFGAIGTRRIYLQLLDLADLDHLRLVAAEVMPHV